MRPASVPGTFAYTPLSGYRAGGRIADAVATFTPTNATDYNTAAATGQFDGLATMQLQ